MRAGCWCCRASSTCTAMRSSASCSRAPAWISRRRWRWPRPRRSCSPTASPPPITASPCRGSRGCAASTPGTRWSMALHARAWVCDMRVHLRWEAFNLDALDVALADIAAGRVHLLAFNDHTPAILRRAGRPGGRRQIQRPRRHAAGGVRALADGVGARADEVAPALDRIAAAARAAGTPMASHDDDTSPARDGFRAPRRAHLRVSDGRGGRRARPRAAGDFVAMGSPNVVRGGSIWAGPRRPRWRRRASAAC